MVIKIYSFGSKCHCTLYSSLFFCLAEKHFWKPFKFCCQFSLCHSVVWCWKEWMPHWRMGYCGASHFSSSSITNWGCWALDSSHVHWCYKEMIWSYNSILLFVSCRSNSYYSWQMVLNSCECHLCPTPIWTPTEKPTLIHLNWYYRTFCKIIFNLFCT